MKHQQPQQNQGSLADLGKTKNILSGQCYCLRGAWTAHHNPRMSLLSARCLFCDPKGMTGFEASNTSAVQLRVHVMSHSNTLSSHFSDPLSARLTDCDDTICRSSRNQSQMPTAEHDWCNDAGYHNKHTKIMHSSRKVWRVVSSNVYNSYSWKQVGIKQHGL